MQTILCKNIISEDIETFKNQINGNYNFGALSDQMYYLTQNILLEIYGNCSVRYETANNFLNALSLRFKNVAPVYEKKFDILTTALDIEDESFIKEIKNFAEDKTNIIISSQNDYRKEAETPTTIKSDTDFIDKYTNSASKNKTDGRSDEAGTISHNETNANQILDKIEKLNNWRDLLMEKYAKEYSNLFIQFY